MTQFNQVSVNKIANIYFKGKVTSRTVTFEDGSVKTLGIMLPGDYEFGTDKNELMEISAGELEVLLPGSDDWEIINAGQSFEVPANAKFKLKIKTVTDYCCSYFD